MKAHVCGILILLSTSGAMSVQEALAAQQTVSTVQTKQIWEVLPPTPALPQPDLQSFVEVGGAKLWYAEYGTKNTGVPVLLLHGGFGNSAYFGHLIPDLVSQKYHVIVMDSRGQGRSGRSKEPNSYHLMAQDVVGLLDHLKVQKVDLVGWSDGGCIGYDLAINYSDRLNRLFVFGADSATSGLKDDYGDTPTFAEYLVRTKEEYEKLSQTPNQYDDFSTDMMHMWNNEPNYTTEQLNSIRTPTTIADGQYDEGIRPEHNVYLRDSIPAANLIILPNVSHFAMLQRPAEFNEAVLSFLKWR